jgi:hypothetical protein
MPRCVQKLGIVRHPPVPSLIELSEQPTTGCVDNRRISHQEQQRSRSRRNLCRQPGPSTTAVPDITAEVIRSDQVGDTVWSEWEMTGTRRDGGTHLMRGVMVFSLDGDRARALRFYLEPVDRTGLDVDEAVRQHLTEPRP